MSKWPLCRCRETEIVLVHIDADLACEGKEKWRGMKIDKCIAPLVKALQEGGINMRGSCCGHGKTIGEISLSDGRKLLIYPTSNQWIKKPALQKFKEN